MNLRSDLLRSQLAEQVNLVWIALLRIFIGAYFLIQGLSKLDRGRFTHPWLTNQLGRLADADLLPFYKRFLFDVVLPHDALFSTLIVIGEILVGASLLFGLLVRVSVPFGIFLNLNYFLAFGWRMRLGSQAGVNLLFILCQIIIFFTSAGRSLGLDGLLHRPRDR